MNAITYPINIDWDAVEETTFCGFCLGDKVIGNTTKIISDGECVFVEYTSGHRSELIVFTTFVKILNKHYEFRRLPDGTNKQINESLVNNNQHSVGGALEDLIKTIMKL